MNCFVVVCLCCCNVLRGDVCVAVVFCLVVRVVLCVVLVCFVCCCFCVVLWWFVLFGSFVVWRWACCVWYDALVVL